MPDRKSRAGFWFLVGTLGILAMIAAGILISILFRSAQNLQVLPFGRG